MKEFNDELKFIISSPDDLTLFLKEYSWPDKSAAGKDKEEGSVKK